MNKFDLVIYTPIKTVKEQNVLSASIKTDLGKIEFLANHADFLASFSASTLNIALNAKHTKKLKVYDGIIRFNREKNTLSIMCSGIGNEYIEEQLLKVNNMLKQAKLSEFSVNYLKSRQLTLKQVKQLK